MSTALWLCTIKDRMSRRGTQSVWTMSNTVRQKHQTGGRNTYGRKLDVGARRLRQVRVDGIGGTGAWVQTSKALIVAWSMMTQGSHMWVI